MRQGREVTRSHLLHADGLVPDAVTSDEPAAAVLMLVLMLTACLAVATAVRCDAAAVLMLMLMLTACLAVATTARRDAAALMQLLLLLI